MVKELDKTLKVDNDTYNINAVEADHVANKLTITKSNLDGSMAEKPWFTYDGSVAVGTEQKPLTIVPATGGGFTGRITVPNFENATMDPKAVLNYGDITKVVLTNMLNNSTLYKWDASAAGDKLTPVIANGTINGISIVTGREDTVIEFTKYNNAEVAAGRGILNFLYISTSGADHGYIYYGVANKSILRLAASHALYLKSTTDGILSYSAEMIHSAITDINSNIEDILNTYNGIISGDVSVGKASSLTTDNGVTTGQELTDAIYTLQDNIGKLVSGETPVGKATTATNASKLNGQDASYYQKKITIAKSSDYPNGPTGGSNGDIMILY